MKFLLIIFGWLAVITSLSIIVVPYLRRRADLLSPWNLFQLGCANFLGMTAIQSGTAYVHYYTVPMQEDYLKFVLGGLVFYFVSIVTFYWLPWPRQVGQMTLRKTGLRTPAALLTLIPICLCLSLGNLFFVQVQFVGQWMIMLGRASSVIAVAFVMVIWAQRPFNVLWGVIFVGIMGFAMISGSTDFGRRDLLAVVMTVPICWYWLKGRYLDTARVVTMCVIFMLGIGLILMGITTVRGMRSNADQNILAAAWTKLKSIPSAIMNRGEGGTSTLVGGDAVEASLASIRLYDSVQPTQPFHAFKYVTLHWIPRAWWPNKPTGLGETLPKDTGWQRAHRSGANLGPGVVGHGYHEGGLFFVAFYAFCMASIIRWFQTMLERDPTNPYLLGAFGACSGQLIAWVRGDIGLFTAIMIGAWISAMLMNYLARIFFGTDRIPSAQEAAYAAAAQPEYSIGEPIPPHAEAWRI